MLSHRPGFNSRYCYNSTGLAALRDLASIDAEPRDFGSLQGRLGRVLANSAFPDRVQVYHEWLPRVARYSFEVGQAFQPGALERIQPRVSAEPWKLAI